MLRFVADENFNGNIVRGLLRRSAEIDICRVQDIGLSGVDDPSILAWAARDDRIVLTHDAATMIAFAYARVDAGQKMPGLCIVPASVPIAKAIDDLLLLATVGRADDCADQVTYLPL